MSTYAVHAGKSENHIDSVFEAGVYREISLE